MLGANICVRDGFPKTDISKPKSNLWRGICQVWDQFRDCLVRRLGNGENTFFWKDAWLPRHCALKEAPHLAQVADIGEQKVSELI